MDGARWVGLDRVDRTGLIALSIALLMVLVAVFSLLVLEAWRGRASFALVMGASAVALALAAAAPVLLSRDLYSYAAYGRVFAVHGANPYVTPPAAFPADPFVGVTSPQWIHTRSLYGPAFVLGASAISRVQASSPAATIIFFKGVAAAAALAAAWLSGRATLHVRPDRGAFAAAAIGLNPVVVIHGVGGGHNDAVIACLLAGAAVLAARSVRTIRPPSGDRPGRLTSGSLPVTVLLTLVVLIKAVVVVPLLVWFWFLWRRGDSGHRLRSVAVHAGLAAAVAGACFAPFAAGRRTFAPLATLSSVEGWASGARLVARAVRAVVGVAASTSVTRAAGTATLALFLLVFAIAFLRLARRVDEASLVSVWGVGLLGFALAAPYLTPWYALWFLPFVTLVEDVWLTVVALGAACVLALTGVPAEPGGAPGAWRTMMLGVHYGAAPLMLGLFVAVLWRMLTREPAR
jgi:alpha-1,6-mannosyltransferase